MKVPGQRRSSRYAPAAVGVTGTVALSGPGARLRGEPDAAMVCVARSYPNRVACGKLPAAIPTPTLKVMSEGEVMVTEGAPASELPIAGVEDTVMSFGQGSTRLRWIALPVFG